MKLVSKLSAVAQQELEAMETKRSKLRSQVIAINEEIAEMDKAISTIKQLLSQFGVLERTVEVNAKPKTAYDPRAGVINPGSIPDMVRGFIISNGGTATAEQIRSFLKQNGKKYFYSVLAKEIRRGHLSRHVNGEGVTFSVLGVTKDGEVEHAQAATAH